MDEETANYIEVKQGGRHLLDSNQFEYRVAKKKPNKTYYQCIQRKNNSCPAGAVINFENDKIISFLGEHSHDSDLLKKRVREIEKQVVKESSGNIAISPRTVLGNMTNMVSTLTNEGVSAMSKSNTLVQAVKRARVEHFGLKVPKSWNDMSVPQHLETTIRGDRFLAINEHLGDENSERIIIFCSSEQHNVLKSAKYWVADGTFDVVKKTLFYQLFIITAVTATGITVPCCFALLPNKETSSYQRVFQYLKDANVTPPGSLKTDFEKAMMQGFLNCYPDVPVMGCDTHFKRAIRRKMTSTELGLGSLYQNNVDFQTLVRYLWALSLVPEEDIVRIWEDVISSRSDELKPSFEDNSDQVDLFLEYFEKTWIGPLNWRTGARRNPIFPHAVWNKYETILSDDPLTSNAAEGFNAAFALSLPNNASIWALIQPLRTEENSIDRKMRDVLLGPQNNVATATTSRNLGRDQR
ncbi:uncharacterized protein LOC111714145 [Eurytemora carolleeae]|uniref:uncharacterized protein LOC111714145 n=1 Tax=Eurytemora carolleeae TaxID=1294199 RepID=UPI000C771195|nr:uncharacterized protein LOC111714145 [Eurytemora carolleeae]|eukprot:XP_023344961.1 uncharacterized protein LOC111714145 [Eurytemora affinis]